MLSSVSCLVASALLFLHKSPMDIFVNRCARTPEAFAESGSGKRSSSQESRVLEA